MRKSVLVALSAILLMCSCASRYEKGAALLESEDRATQLYYETFADEQSDPVAFAKKILAGSYDSKIKEWYPHSRMVPMIEALNKKWVHYGMTYEEIKEVCGKGHEYTLSGRLDHVGYGDSHYGSTTYMLYFERGRLDHVNSF